MDVQLIRAGRDLLPVIKNLVPYYIYDLSAYMGWDCTPDGHYDGCDELPEYWEKRRHYPHLIRVDGKIAGFALVRPTPEEPERTEMGDFFVLRKFAGKGVGRTVACRLFDAHRGPWLVRVLKGNTGAEGFWRKVIRDYTAGSAVESDEVYRSEHSGAWRMTYFRFDSRKGTRP